MTPEGLQAVTEAIDKFGADKVRNPDFGYALFIGTILPGEDHPYVAFKVPTSQGMQIASLLERAGFGSNAVARHPQMPRLELIGPSRRSIDCDVVEFRDLNASAFPQDAPNHNIPQDSVVAAKSTVPDSSDGVTGDISNIPPFEDFYI